MLSGVLAVGLRGRTIEGRLPLSGLMVGAGWMSVLPLPGEMFLFPGFEASWRVGG